MAKRINTYLNGILVLWFEDYYHYFYFFLTNEIVIGQPSWVPHIPNTSNITAINTKMIDIQLDAAGTIYWLVYTYDATVSASLIKAWHTNPVTGTFRGGGTITWRR